MSDHPRSIDGVWQEAARAYADARLGTSRRAPEVHAGADFAVILTEMAELGFDLLCRSEAQEGLAQDEFVLASVLHALCTVDASVGAAIYAQGAAQLALRAVSEGAIRGTDLACAWIAWPAFHALGELAWPHLDEQGRLHGEVPMLLLGAHARAAVLPARHNDALALGMVDLTAPGCVRSAPVRTLGLAASGIVDLQLQATPAHLLSAGADQLLADLQRRLALPAMAMFCGLMQGSLTTARDYSRQRHQGGGSLLGWGEVRRLLALMDERLAVATALFERHQQNDEVAVMAEHALLHTAALACELCCDGIQLLGGNGYMRASGQEKRWRDAWQLQSLGGSVAWRRQQLLPLT